MKEVIQFLQELSEDSDGLRSSFFLYRDGEGDVIHLGPAWELGQVSLPSL